jgi:hypothetical protein
MQQRLRWTRKYICDLANWMWRAPLIAIGAAAIFVVLIMIFIPCPERKIRLSGMALQLIGVVLVGIGLRDTRQAFDDQPTTWGRIKGFWSKRPKFGPQHHAFQPAGGSLVPSIGEPRMMTRARTHKSGSVNAAR